MNHSQVKSRNAKKIPPPPGLEDGYDAIIEYFNKYSTEEVEKAGHLEEATPQELRDLAASAELWFLCRHGLNLKLPRKDLEKLVQLAADRDETVVALATQWIKQQLKLEATPRSAVRKT